jgi:phage N-6-adenine-methyltransferase
MTIASGKTAAVIPLRGRKVQHYNPEKGLKKIAVTEASERYLRRAIRSPKMAGKVLEKVLAELLAASEEKIVEQAHYIIWRDGFVPTPSARGAQGGRGRKLIPELRLALPDADPGDKVAHRWRKRLCTKTKSGTVIDPAKLDIAITESVHRIKRICEQCDKGTERGTAGTGEFERYTPPQYIEAARKVLGEIDLDPATCVMAQKTVKAKQFFTEDTNGLDREWHGRVWLNPPYHRDLAPAFISKLVEEIDAGHVTAAVMLTNNSTDTDWFDTALRACASVCFTHGRIAFTTPPIGAEVDPTQGQAFFYYGDDPTRFEDVFCVIGSCVRPSRQYIEVE